MSLRHSASTGIKTCKIDPDANLFETLITPGDRVWERPTSERRLRFGIAAPEPSQAKRD